MPRAQFGPLRGCRMEMLSGWTASVTQASAGGVQGWAARYTFWLSPLTSFDLSHSPPNGG